MILVAHVRNTTFWKYFAEFVGGNVNSV